MIASHYYSYMPIITATSIETYQLTQRDALLPITGKHLQRPDKQ